MRDSSGYEYFNLPKRTGFTPSIISLLGGTPYQDSYTPVSTFRYTVDQYRTYLTRDMGRGASMPELIDYLYSVADKYGIPRDLAYKQIQRESGFNAGARGTSGEIGIAQFLPSTAAQYGLSAEDLEDPFKSLDAYGRHMRDLIQMFGGDNAAALAAYNTGPGRVSAAIAKGGDWLQRLSTTTQQYVKAITGDAPFCYDPNSGDIVACDAPGAVPAYGVTSKDAGIGAAAKDFFGVDLGDAGKRIGLVVLAIVLIAVAIVSFR